MKKLSYLMALAVMSFISMGYADGPGPTSKTEFFIQGQAGSFVQVTGVKDVIINNWNGNQADPSTNPSLKQNICVLSNTDYRTYNLKITDENSTLSLKGIDVPGEAPIPYQLRFKSPGDGVSRLIKHPGEGVFPELHGTAYDHCWIGGTNVELDIIIPAVTNPIAGTYGDTIHLIVTPGL
jgi:hypothetical protein